MNNQELRDVLTALVDGIPQRLSAKLCGVTDGDEMVKAFIEVTTPCETIIHGIADIAAEGAFARAVWANPSPTAHRLNWSPEELAALAPRPNPPRTVLWSPQELAAWRGDPKPKASPAPKPAKKADPRPSRRHKK